MKNIVVEWDELTRHRQQFTVPDDFPSGWTSDAAADDRTADRLEELIKGHAVEDANSVTRALSVHEFFDAA
ncbi:hypothetical protein [Rhodococcoides fascians]|uniref:hypothetical protein n=1 Tax=Rhodococcoides fascians TaxID=1828 RepID=UPI00056D0AB0|nr:hypothetical protein [Rhodococcus fascians]